MTPRKAAPKKVTAKKAATPKRTPVKVAAPRAHASASASNAALARFEANFAKTYGEGKLRRSNTITPYEILPTGSLMLDYKLGVGGYVMGRIVEIWGVDGIGKTTLALLGLAEAQRKWPGKKVGFIDVEHKLDKPWARAHGVDLAGMYDVAPDDAEEVADQVKDMIRSGLFSAVVVDSIGSMIPEAEKEKDADEAVVTLQAKIVTRMVKIAAAEADKYGVALLLINQVRANISAYGAGTTTGGGFALKHSSTQKLNLRRTSRSPFTVTSFGETIEIGHEVAVKVERNSVAPAYQIANVSLLNQTTLKYGPIGVDRADEATTLGIQTGIIEQNGGWYTVKVTGERINGREKVVEALRLQPGVIDELRVAALATIADRVYDEEHLDEPEPVPEPAPNGEKPVPQLRRAVAALD